MKTKEFVDRAWSKAMLVVGRKGEVKQRSGLVH
jgi:hypothetical protein